MASTRIANNQDVGLGLFDRAHNKSLGSEGLVGVRGGRIRDALDVARIDVHVRGLGSGYMVGFDRGGDRVTEVRRSRARADDNDCAAWLSEIAICCNLSVEEATSTRSRTCLLCGCLTP